MLKKRKFFAQMFEYLGHVIRPGQLEFIKHTVDAVTKLEHRTTQMKLRYLLSLYTIFSWFVPIFFSLFSSLIRN